MLRAHRLAAVRTCLLIVSIVLASVIAASTDPSRSFASSFVPETGSSLPATGVSAPVEPSVPKRHGSRRKPATVHRGECAAAARAGRQRKARKACVVKKPKTNAKAKASKPSSAATRWSLVQPVSPAEPVAPAEPVSPVEPSPPAEEPTSPVEKPSTPVTPTSPVEEPTPPAEPTPPVEEPTAPVQPVTPVEEPTTPVEPATPLRFFSSTSFWNEPVPADAPLDPSSAAVVGFFDEEVIAEESHEGPNINTSRWSVPVYTVPADQPAVRVELTNGVVALQAAWDAVPLPSDAHPAAGTDEHLVVWQPSTDRLWEFWKLVKTAEGWQAGWGGAMQHVSSNPGVYGPEAWPGADPQWGGSASSLSLAGGLITLEDLQLGQINHALALAIPDVRAGVYALPAHRDDGISSSPLSLPEGAHLRLDPKLDLAALHLPRFTLMLAEAAQRYGIIVRSQGSNVAFYGQDPTPTGTEPYAGPGGYFEGKDPYQLLASFPWSHLQLLKMELHNNS